MERFDIDFEEEETDGIDVAAAFHCWPVAWKREASRREGWAVIADPLSAASLGAIYKSVDVISRRARDLTSCVVTTNYDEIIELAEEMRRSRKPELLSPTIAELDKAIEESVWMLTLRAGWDGPEAQSIGRSTWERAAELIRKLGQSAINQFAEALPVPQIGPVADGSIDLFWNKTSENLLINVPQEPAAPATFDGVRPDGSSITGSIVASDDLAHLTAWLIKR